MKLVNFFRLRRSIDISSFFREETEMISLGTHDQTVSNSDLAKYREYLKKLTNAVALDHWNHQLRDEGKWVDFKPLNSTEMMKVEELQQFLRDAGFLPYARIDGICGYRTAAAIFLFQEYVRTIEGKSEIGFPDGRFGSVSLQHVRRWRPVAHLVRPSLGEPF